ACRRTAWTEPDPPPFARCERGRTDHRDTSCGRGGGAPHNNVNATGALPWGRAVASFGRVRVSPVSDLPAPVRGMAANAESAAAGGLPAASPVPMPGQSLREGHLAAARPATSPPHVGLRRALVVGSTAALTAAAAMGMLQVLRVGGLSLLDGVLLVLFVFLFAWIALSCVSAMAGFVLQLSGSARTLGIDPHGPLPTLHTRTALLMPTYHEDPARIMAGLQAVYESVPATGQLQAFDFFVL